MGRAPFCNNLSSCLSGNFWPTVKRECARPGTGTAVGPGPALIVSLCNTDQHPEVYPGRRHSSLREVLGR